jgi:dihydropteroate synthase
MRLLELATSGDLRPLFGQMGVDRAGVEILSQKSTMRRFRITQLKTPAANILKQEAISVGADLAVPAGTICCESERVEAVLLATDRQLGRLSRKLLAQPFGLKALGQKLRDVQHAPAFPRQVMGVLNINDDSFNPASRTGSDALLERAEAMIEAGAELIDIGAVSSRPGSTPVPAEQELARLKPGIEVLYRAKIHERVVLSLDSYAPAAIAYALDHGFGLINDITGGADPAVLDLAARYKVPLCLMHMQRDPQHMQLNPHYEDVVAEVEDFFIGRTQKAEAAGVKRLILDVGIGFGKTLAHNLALINAQAHFRHLGYPLLIGASRKSLIDAISPAGVADRLPGTLALHLRALEQGAHIIRCHDVAEHVQALRVFQALQQFQTEKV